MKIISNLLALISINRDYSIKTQYVFKPVVSIDYPDKQNLSFRNFGMIRL